MLKLKDWYMTDIGIVSNRTNNLNAGFTNGDNAWYACTIDNTG